MVDSGQGGSVLHRPALHDTVIGVDGGVVVYGCFVLQSGVVCLDRVLEGGKASRYICSNYLHTYVVRVAMMI